MIDTHKAVMIGCGYVGAATVFALMQKGLFSEIALIDVDTSRAEGEAMDISHGVPFTGHTYIHAGTYEDVENADIVIITAGHNSKPDESRLDLTERNVAVMSEIIERINAHHFKGIILVVSNPVDILTYVAWSLSGLPVNQVIGSGTVLDSARLKYLIGSKLNVDPKSVHAFIIGEHGDSEFVVSSRANISGIPLRELCDPSTPNCISGFCNYLSELEDIAAQVKNDAYEIISRKGATYYGIAMAVTRICEAILKNEHSIMPVSSVMTGEYGIEDVALSVPQIIGARGIEGHIPYRLSMEEHSRLHHSARILKDILEKLHIPLRKNKIK